MLENDLTARSIKCAATLPLSERSGIAKSLNTNNTADLSYILFSSEDQPQLREPYWRLHYSRLIRSFIIHADSNDILILSRLRDFIEFFVGYHKYSESEINNSISDLYICGMHLFWYPVYRRGGAQIPKEFYELCRVEISVEKLIWYKDQVIKAVDNLFQEEASTY